MSIMFVTLVTFLVVTGTVLALGAAVRREVPVAQRVRQMVGNAPAPTRRERWTTSSRSFTNRHRTRS